MAAIAQQELEVGRPFHLDSTQSNSLHQSVHDLIAAGHVEEAKVVFALLLERGDVDASLRIHLMQQISQPAEGWRLQIKQLIERQQPFRVVYQNENQLYWKVRNRDGNRLPQDARLRSMVGEHRAVHCDFPLLECTVRYAAIVKRCCKQIACRDKQHYLQVWCDEESMDLSEFRHNRTFRLDHIVAILPVSGEWRGHFDTIEVHLQFRGELAQTYAANENDIQDETIDGVRHVVRKVANLPWFLREVRYYGGECVIVAPQEVRDRALEVFLTIVEQYK